MVNFVAGKSLNVIEVVPNIIKTKVYQTSIQTVFQTVFPQALAEQKNKFDRDMLLNRGSMSEDEYRRLLAEHQREMAALVANMDKEKDRQKRAIKDRVGVT